MVLLHLLLLVVLLLSCLGVMVSNLASANALNRKHLFLLAQLRAGLNQEARGGSGKAPVPCAPRPARCSCLLAGDWRPLVRRRLPRLRVGDGCGRSLPRAPRCASLPRGCCAHPEQKVDTGKMPMAMVPLYPRKRRFSVRTWLDRKRKPPTLSTSLKRF